MIREADVRAFAAAHRDGAVVVDVREPFEYAGGPLVTHAARSAQDNGARR